MWGFGYSYLEDQLASRGLEAPALLDYQGPWGTGSEYAYEVLNLVDGARSIGTIRDSVAASYGPLPVDLVSEYIAVLEAIGVVSCSG